MISQKFMYGQLDVKNREELFDKIGKQLFDNNIVKDGFSQALKEREREFPTGLPVEYGVAIPHTDGQLVNQDQLCFITLKTPIEFNEMGGEDTDIIQVKLVILLAIKEGKKHLETLQNLIASIQKQGFVKGLITSENTTQMNQIINTYL